MVLPGSLLDEHTFGQVAYSLQSLQSASATFRKPNLCFVKHLSNLTRTLMNHPLALMSTCSTILPSRKGFLRYDDFSMVALKPREEFIIGAGPYTAAVVTELLLEYTVDELFLQAGISPHSPYRDSRDIFSNRPLQDVIQAVGDAFQRLDNDLLKKAARAITGSRPLQASMTDLVAAEAGCSALLATYDTASQYLIVANVGSSRAVLGHRIGQGAWEARALSVEHTCQNENEVARLRAEHPDEADMLKDGQLLGNTLTRAFGNLRLDAYTVAPCTALWKLSAKMQSIAQTRFFGDPPLPSLLTPPYMTAEPSLSATKIDPKNNDFVILASDGLWDHLTSEQAVRLVGRWLAQNDPSKPLKEESTSDSLDLLVADSNPDVSGTWQGLLVREPENVATPARDYTKAKFGEEKNWVVEDDNAATHLARNALGGADRDLFCALSASVKAKLYPMRRLRQLAAEMMDDITIQVIFFGHGDPATVDLKLNGDDQDSSDTLDLT
ncbi:MAG: hypothetical protein Q9168_001625 [Polycauliona sp. 1 TL-2023]